MSLASFGMGLGAFAQGMNQGIDTGQKLGGMIQQGKLRRAQKQGMEDAEAARESAIDNLVQVGAAPNADNTMTMPTYQIGDETFADEASMRKAAEDRVGSLEDFYAKVAVPKIYEKYLEIDPEKAEIWKQLNDNKQFQRGRSLWARGVQAASLGDYETAGKYFQKAYNTQGYFDDGNTIDKFEMVKGKDGKPAGVRLVLKMANGETINRDMGVEEAMRMGAMFGDPEKVLEAGLAHLNAEGKAVADFETKSALQRQKDNAALERAKLQGGGADGRDYRASVSDRDLYNQAFQFYAKQHTDPLTGKRLVADEELHRMAAEYVRKVPRHQQEAANPLAGGIPVPPGYAVFDTKTGQMAR